LCDLYLLKLVMRIM